jgi:hypothetical protein
MSKKTMQLALDYLTRLRTMSQYENIDALYSAETTERLAVVAALEADLAANQLAIPAGWQPIETAPDDFVLVHEDGAMRALIHTNGKWKSSSYPALVSIAWGDALVGDAANHLLAPLGYRLELRDGCCKKPTEWMPLPATPNPESKS